MKHSFRINMMAFAVATAVAVAGSAAFAAKPLGVGGGKKPTTELGNNLSQPAKFLSGGTTNPPTVRVPCDTYSSTTNQDPTLLPVLQADTNYYWLQKSESTWTADCSSGVTVTDYGSVVELKGDWGDNLTGGGMLKAGKPIRVEMGLFEVIESPDGPIPVSGSGYPITNLTPDLADRLATYGLKCVSDCTVSPVAAIADMPYRVFDGTARLTIVQTAPTAKSIYDGPMTAEINSTGGVVYGFNWGTSGRTNAPQAGTYEIEFTIDNPNSHMGSVADGTLCTPDDDTTGGCARVTIVLTAGGRGGPPPGSGEGEE
jgi:hypothetical protein